MTDLERQLLTNLCERHGLDGLLHELARMCTAECRRLALGHDLDTAKALACGAEMLEETANAYAAL